MVVVLYSLFLFLFFIHFLSQPEESFAAEFGSFLTLIFYFPDLLVQATIGVKKYGQSSDHIPRSNPVLTLLLHCPRVHGFSLFGKLDRWIAGLPDFTVYQNYEKTAPPVGWCRVSCLKSDVSVSQSDQSEHILTQLRWTII